MHTKAIPTMYRERYYRSRLEARYAALFDALEWPYEYEPIDIAGRRRGYIPDFLVTWDTSTLLVEVKPYTLPFGADALATCMRIADAWDGHALLVGATHNITIDERTDPEIRLDESGMFPVVESARDAGLFDEGTIEIGRLRVEGERFWDAAYLAHDGERWGVSRIDDPCTHLDAPNFARARWAWATAGNLTQWRGADADRGKMNGR